MPASDRLILPTSGYTPTIGRLVAMLEYVRRTLLAAVQGMTRQQLDHLHDASSNSIGALIAHAVAVERYYQVLTFEERDPEPSRDPMWLAALELGDGARRVLHGRDLANYVDELFGTRAATLAALRARDDEWLERPLASAARMNPHWAWFHVAEDEINHRGQIRWLRARVPEGSTISSPA